GACRADRGALDEARPPVRHLQRREPDPGAAAARRRAAPARAPPALRVRSAALPALGPRPRAPSLRRLRHVVGFRVEPRPAARPGVRPPRRRARLPVRQPRRSARVSLPRRARPDGRQARRRRMPRRRTRRRPPSSGVARARGRHHRRRRRLQRSVPRVAAPRRAARPRAAPRQPRSRPIHASSRRARVKIAVIGGAGIRTPLLVDGLTRSDLPIDEIALFDIDRDRLAAIEALARSFSPAVRAYDDAAAAVRSSAFVFLSIRVGGIAARARDEAAAMAHGIVGQETVGPGGFAMAMRTVARAVEYAALVSRIAPDAWVVNFTNPVGIVTQAITQRTAARVVGICDTPTELFEEAAHALGVDVTRCVFDYFGLNHLGWLREVVCDGVPQLARAWDDEALLARMYRAPLFEPSFLRTLRLLP